jgi:hypothetical protein
MRSSDKLQLKQRQATGLLSWSRGVIDFTSSRRFVLSTPQIIVHPIVDPSRIVWSKPGCVRVTVFWRDWPKRDATTHCLLVHDLQRTVGELSPVAIASPNVRVNAWQAELPPV